MTRTRVRASNVATKGLVSKQTNILLAETAAGGPSFLILLGGDWIATPQTPADSSLWCVAMDGWSLHRQCRQWLVSTALPSSFDLAHFLCSSHSKTNGFRSCPIYQTATSISGFNGKRNIKNEIDYSVWYFICKCNLELFWWLCEVIFMVPA